MKDIRCVIARQGGATTRSGEDRAIHAHKLSSLGQGDLMLSDNSATRCTRAGSMVLTGIASRSKPLRRGRKQFRARWLLPLVFVAGYVATFNRFEAFIVEYTVLTGVSILVCCLLLRRFNRSVQVTLPFWVILGFFLLAYYVKFYWIALFPEVGIGSYIYEAAFFSTDALFFAYATTTYAFGGFCLAAWFLLGKSRDSKQRTITPKGVSDPMGSTIRYRFVSSVALLIALFLIPVTTFIMYITEIGIMGLESVYLPFRLAGFIFYTRTIFVPAMLLLLIWCSQQAGLRKRTTVGIILLFVHGLSDMVLRSSRGGLANLLLLFGFLLLVSGRRFHKRYLLFFASGLLLVSFLFPIISEYRSLRIDLSSDDIVSVLAIAQHNVLGGGLSALWDTLEKGIELLLLRLSGVDLLVVYNGLGVQALGGNAWYVLASLGMAGYVSTDIFRISPNAFNAAAPGLIGWFYLIGGNSLAVAGIAGFTSLAYILWGMLKRIRLKCLPVAQALFMSLLLTMAVDGTLDSFVAWPILAWPLSIAVCEWIIRVRGGMK